MGLVLRRVVNDPPSFEALGLPPVVRKLAEEHRGLVLVTGPTGSGKSTTAAAMVAHINATRRCHVVTIEDPVEIVHRNQVAVVDQREIGADTSSFGTALRSVARQDPDVIFLGEMRDLETVEAALQVASTGHLVISTLHTIDATETVNRIIDLFPPTHQRQVRVSFAAAMKGIVSQRLIPRADGRGRVPAIEVLINTGRVMERIMDPAHTFEIYDVMAEGEFYGMQTFDQSLVALVMEGLITEEEAKLASTTPHDFTLAMKAARMKAAASVGADFTAAAG